MKKYSLFTLFIPAIMVLNGCDSDAFNTTSPDTESSVSKYELVVKNESIPLDFEVPITAQLVSKETGLSQDVTNEVLLKSSDSSIIQIVGENKALAKTVGGVNLEAEIEYLGYNYSTVIQLTAKSVSVDSLVINSVNDSIGLGESIQYTAIATFDDGTTLDVTQQANSKWESDDDRVVKINEKTGEATAISEGTAIISLSGIANGINYSGNKELTVTGSFVTDIAITPNSSYIKGGLTKQYTANAVYSDSHTAIVTSDVNWSVDVPSIATIDTVGLLTADSNNSGQVTITGEYTIDGKSFSSNAFLVVDNNETTISSFSIKANPTAPILSEYKVKALAVYTDGNSYDVSDQTSWSIDNTSLASIDDSGLLTIYENAGPLEITATYKGNTEKVNITITSSSLESVAISPRNVSLINGFTEKLQATLNLKSGESLDISTYSTLTWNSDESSIASVDSTGLVTAQSLGQTNITITGSYNSESFSDSISIEVVPGVIKELTVTPRNSVLTEGQSIPLIAQVTLSNSKVIDVSDSVQISWSSDNQSVVDITSPGIVTANTPGETIINASYKGFTDSVFIGVVGSSVTDVAQVDIASDQSATLPVGFNANFNLLITSSTDAKSSITSGTGFSWVSDTPAIADIDPSTGFLTTYKAGGPVEISISGDIAGVAPSSNYSLTVSAAEISSIKIPEGNIQTRLGVPVILSANATYTDGSTNPTNSIAWSSSNPDVGSIDPSGTFTPGKVGFTTIKATETSSFLIDEISLEVKPASLDFLEVEFVSGVAQVQVGTKEQLIVTGTWEDGQTNEITRFTDFSTSDKDTATIDAKGVITAYKAGNIDITASIGGTFSDTVSNVLVFSPIKSLNFLYTDTKIPFKGTMQTNVFDQDGTNVNGLVVFESQNESIMTVSDTGLITAVGVGQATITATLGTVKDSVVFETISPLAICGGAVNDTSPINNTDECIKLISSSDGVFSSTPSKAAANSLSFTDFITTKRYNTSNTNSVIAPAGVDMLIVNYPMTESWCQALNAINFNSRNNWSIPTMAQSKTLYNEVGGDAVIYNNFNFPFIGAPIFSEGAFYILDNNYQAFSLQTGVAKSYNGIESESVSNNYASGTCMSAN